MTRQHKTTHIILFAIILIFTGKINAETIEDKDFGFLIDIPEGYEVVDYTQDGMSYHFTHPNIPVDLILKINDLSKTGGPESSTDALNLNMGKLKAEYQGDNFYWNNTQVAISTFKMTIDKKYAGWAISAPTVMNSCYLTLLCYAPEEQESACEQFIMSTLNGLCIDKEAFNTPGIITSYAFPPEGRKEISLKIGGNSIKTSIDNIDEEAAQFVVDLEYAVLSLYGKHNLWKEAWQRYYRMIYRDGYARLSSVSSDIFETLYPLAKKQNPQNADIAYAQMLLSWVQEFHYKRDDDPKKADFTCLPSVLTGTGNDCDSRSLLICTLLKSAGVECLLLVSPEYSHAMAAAGINAPGQQYELEGTDLSFIMGETTAKVTWGTIAQDLSDRTKWFPVILP